jgi:hypothetical protein
MSGCRALAAAALAAAVVRTPAEGSESVSVGVEAFAIGASAL